MHRVLWQRDWDDLGPVCRDKWRPKPYTDHASTALLSNRRVVYHRISTKMSVPNEREFRLRRVPLDKVVQRVVPHVLTCWLATAQTMNTQRVDFSSTDALVWAQTAALRCNATAIRKAASLSRVPTAEQGSAWKKAPEWGAAVSTLGSGHCRANFVWFCVLWDHNNLTNCKILTPHSKQNYE